MDIFIKPKKLLGSVNVPASKSYAHRALIAAALSDKETHIYLNGISDDILATIGALRAIGASLAVNDDKISVKPIKTLGKEAQINCLESGSTLRFMLPVAALNCAHTDFCGCGRLPDRPIFQLTEQMRKNGVSVSSDTLPLTTDGRLSGGCFSFPGNVSSQYITGLLLALPAAENDSEILLTSPLQSKPYADMTVSMLEHFGIRIEYKDNRFFIRGRQRYISPGAITVESDWSNAAFWLVCGVTVKGLNEHSLQGDKAIKDILAQMKQDGEIKIDASDIPDAVPAICIAAAARNGKTVIYNAQRLILKESNRLKSCHDMLTALGGNISVTDDGLIIIGTGSLIGGTVSGCGDHRIVMASAAASAFCSEPVIIKGAQAANKSYPAFFDDFKTLGGEAHVV